MLGSFSITLPLTLNAVVGIDAGAPVLARTAVDTTWMSMVALS